MTQIMALSSLSSSPITVHNNTNHNNSTNNHKELKVIIRNSNNKSDYAERSSSNRSSNGHQNYTDNDDKDSDSDNDNVNNNHRTTATTATATASNISYNNNNNDSSSNNLDYDHDYDDDEGNVIVLTDEMIMASTFSGKCKLFYAEHCIYLPAMMGWFLFSAALSAYNKMVFGNTHGAFPCPLLLTSIHFLVQWIFSHCVTTFFPLYCGTDRLKSMSWKEWLTTSVPCGIVTSGDVGLSNLSLVTISMTFYTMVKSSTPIFVLLWAYLFGIEKITWNLIFVVIIISFGETLTVAGEVDFHPVGFTLCLSASVLSGARWTLVQLKLRSMDPPLKTTITTMRLLAPSMFLSMMLISFCIEQPWHKLQQHGTLSQNIHELVLLGLLGGVIAICMILCEFWLIMRASAIVLMIGGVLKEMTTIVVGVTYFGDELNRINASGCFVVFIGVFYYKFTHYVDSKRDNNNSQANKSSDETTLITSTTTNADATTTNNNNNNIINSSRSNILLTRNRSGEDICYSRVVDDSSDGRSAKTRSRSFHRHGENSPRLCRRSISTEGRNNIMNINNNMIVPSFASSTSSSHNNHHHTSDTLC